MPVQLGRSTSALRRGQPSAATRGAATMASMKTSRLGTVRSTTSSSAAAGGTSDGCWSVAGPGGAYRRELAERVFRLPKFSLPGSYPPPGLSPPSSAPSSLRPGGTSTSSIPMSRLPPRSSVLVRPMVSPNRWNDGPTSSVWEGESVREAVLRALDAPRAPVLHPGRAAERPDQRRQRYLESS